MKLSLQSDFANRWLWACPALMLLLAVLVLWLFGLGWWSAILAALLLVCPVLIAWGVIRLVLDERRDRRRRGR